MRPPEPLTPEHNIAEFCCQDQVINEWLLGDNYPVRIATITLACL